MRASDSLAISSARSGVFVMKALRLRAPSIADMKACVSSVDEIFFARTASRASASVKSTGSLMPPLPRAASRKKPTSPNLGNPAPADSGETPHVHKRARRPGDGHLFREPDGGALPRERASRSRRESVLQYPR